MIHFGTAGTPGKDSFDGLEILNKNNLDAMEVEFVRGVKMSIETAKKIGEAAKKFNIILSVHAPYYINLCSSESVKRDASIKRILDSCERAHYLKAKYVTFHPAFYGETSKEECYSIVKAAIGYMQEKIKNNLWDVVLCPETTGKSSQFGSLDELVKLSKETGCGICVDFAHILARDGKIDYDAVCQKIKFIEHKYAHFSGIEFTDKGERKHLLTKEKDIKELLSHLIKNRIDLTIINESPEPFNDALKSKEIYAAATLKYK